MGNWNQRVYMLEKRNGDIFKEPPVSKDYQIVKMRDVLLEDRKQSIKNTTFLQSKIKEFWPSYDEFLMNGIGYCVLYKNEIVSICFTGFAVENVHCVDIETLKEHRGKNLAKKVAFAFIKECLESNLVAYWDCMESNKPSIAVAENLGFELVFNYTGYEFQM